GAAGARGEVLAGALPERTVGRGAGGAGGAAAAVDAAGGPRRADRLGLAVPPLGRGRRRRRVGAVAAAVGGGVPAGAEPHDRRRGADPGVGPVDRSVVSAPEGRQSVARGESPWQE